jgi:hypothetical protein
MQDKIMTSKELKSEDDAGGGRMNELLKLDDNGNQTVSARELHSALGVGRDFSTWIAERCLRRSPQAWNPSSSIRLITHLVTLRAVARTSLKGSGY